MWFFFNLSQLKLRNTGQLKRRLSGAQGSREATVRERVCARETKREGRGEKKESQGEDVK